MTKKSPSSAVERNNKYIYIILQLTEFIVAKIQLFSIFVIHSRNLQERT